MQATQAALSNPHDLLNLWPPAPHQDSGSESANGARLHLFDGPHAVEDRRNAHHLPREYPVPYRQPAPAARPDWKLATGKLFTPAVAPYHNLPAELEPLPQYTELPRAPQYYSPHVDAIENVFDEDDSIDITALADQYLDLSDHCPLPSRSATPSAHSTDTSETTDIELRPAKRRCTTHWDMPRLPTTQTSDDESIGGHSHCSRPRTGLSPFYHSPSPSQDNELPEWSHHPHPDVYAVRPIQPATREAGPTLKFTESRRDGRSKRQALACLFCRARKIACGRPSPGSSDQTCNQCARRRIDCVYPTESRRGQHSRIKSLARRAQEAHNLGVLLPVLQQ